jgi:hypothetical protein
VAEPETRGEELVLGAHVVVEGDVGEGMEGGVGGGCGLPVAEEGGDDDAVFGWIEDTPRAEEPFVVFDCLGVLAGGKMKGRGWMGRTARVPGGVDDGREADIAVDLIRDLGIWNRLAGLEFPVSQLVFLNNGGRHCCFQISNLEDVKMSPGAA